jgi:superfamily II DNA/RNA helicase
MHSDHSQFKREQILRAFRTEGLNVLIATDVAARGLDIQEVNLVIQVGFPANGIEYYIHRSGRCGRAGRLGTSILLDDGKTKIDRDLFRLVQFKKLALPDSIPENVLDDISDDFETERKPFNNSYRKPRYLSNQDRQKTSYNGLDDISGDSATERKPFNNSYRKPRYLSNQDSYNQDRPKTSYNRDRMNIEGQYKNYRSKSSSEFDREDKWSSY